MHRGPNDAGSASGSSRCCCPLYDPVKLAEDLAVLDLASGGRVGLTAGIGYRPDEYAMFGRDFGKRGALMDENLEVLLRAWRGEEFEYGGRRVSAVTAPRHPAPSRFSRWGAPENEAPCVPPASACLSSRPSARPSSWSSTGPSASVWATSP